MCEKMDTNYFSNLKDKYNSLNSHNDIRIDKITGLTAEAEKARDYLMHLPDRMQRITERIVIPNTKYT